MSTQPSQSLPTKPYHTMSNPPPSSQTRTSTRASVRFSTYSDAATVRTCATTESAVAEFQGIERSLDRIEKGDKRLSEQRVELDENKRVFFQKLALGAKLDRALGRRMSGQDAVMRKRTSSSVSQKGLSEKDAEKVAAAA